MLIYVAPVKMVQYCENYVVYVCAMPTKQFEARVCKSPSISSDTPVKKLFAVAADTVSQCDSTHVCTDLLYFLIMRLNLSHGMVVYG